METAGDTSRDLPLLTANEARLLGCLIEKEATTPDTYPLTVNSAQSAANQKTAREPVMALDTGEVNHTLRQLEQKALARQVFSTRAERYEHRAGTYFGLPKQQVVLIGLLLLRGAQTAHELLARSERLFKFADIEDVRHHLDRLIQRQPALVVQIPRGPGQREDRYMHLLTGPVDIEAIAARSAAASATATASPEVDERLQALEAEVSELREQLAQLRIRLGD